MKLTPYLMFFNGDCREAFDFYAGALGGQIILRVTYGDMPADPSQPPLPEEAKSQLAHVNLLVGEASIMGGDSIMGCGGSEKIDGRNDTTVNIEVDTVEEAERVFHSHAAGVDARAQVLGERDNDLFTADRLAAANCGISGGERRPGIIDQRSVVRTRCK